MKTPLNLKPKHLKPYSVKITPDTRKRFQRLVKRYTVEELIKGICDVVEEKERGK